MNNYPYLFSPLKVGNLTLRNRIEAAPTAPWIITPEGYFNHDTIAYFELKAAGGAAIVHIGECLVHSKTSIKIWPDTTRLDDPNSFAGLALAARAIKRHRAIPSIELQHPGKSGGYNPLTGRKDFRYGPSHEITADGSEILEMPEELILEIVDSFGKAASAMKSIGFEMLLLHGGHGWLISQFLSPLENKRTDKFGGSFENRARLALMIIDSVRKAVGPGFPIEFRMNGDEFIPGGFTQEDGIRFAKMIDGKVDLIHVSAGSHEVRKLYVRTHPSMFLPLGPNVYLAAEIKKHVKTPVATVGGITEVEMMEDIVASGKADVVALGRPLLADPYLPKKAAAGRPEDITPCLRCFTCLSSRPLAPWTCSVNPVIGNEYENKFLKPGPEKYKKVLIAGGGPAGMQAAITASARGHRVFLCEKSSSLGGAIRYAQYVPFKSDLEKFRKHLEYMLKASGAVVMMNTEVTPEFVAAQNPDVLIAAIGATPIVPNIRGIHNKKVIMAADVHNAGAEIGDKVVIIGGGLVGCEEGLHLAMQGKAVTVVEMLDVVARDANRHHKSALTQEMEKYARNMKIVTKTKAKAITEEGLLCEGPDGKEVLYEADTVICAVGYKSLTSVVDQMRIIVPEFYDIGDCVKPQTVTEAIRTGYNAAMEL